jgi:hypothetical protein
MKVVMTGGRYFTATSTPPWTSKIENASRFTADGAQRLVDHINKGPAKEVKGKLVYSPTWKWVQSPVSVGHLVGFREIRTPKTVNLADGTTEIKIEKKMERFEYEGRPVFEIVEVEDGELYDMLAHFCA